MGQSVFQATFHGPDLDPFISYAQSYYRGIIKHHACCWRSENRNNCYCSQKAGLLPALGALER